MKLVDKAWKNAPPPPPQVNSGLAVKYCPSAYPVLFELSKLDNSSKSTINLWQKQITVLFIGRNLGYLSR